MIFYAHTLKDQPKEKWEPLFTPFGEKDNQCQRDTCQKCADMEPQHGHLNKVAYWTAKFASEMFPKDSLESISAGQWGYLTGLWHDLGKFSDAFQKRLEGSEQPVDHSTAGSRHCLNIPH